MLDIKLIRENPELVKNNLAKRGNPENTRMLDDLIATDREWRQNLTKLNDLRHERKEVTKAEEKTHDYLMRLPNLLHETVPVGQGENDNVQVRTSGKIPKFNFPPKNHIALGLNLT